MSAADQPDRVQTRSKAHHGGGLLAASAALIISAVWLVAAFTVARSDLARGIDHGSSPASTLAQASIDVQQARGDEILNLISRTGATSFEQDYRSVRAQIGPGAGTLLTTAASASQGLRRGDQPGDRDRNGRRGGRVRLT